MGRKDEKKDDLQDQEIEFMELDEEEGSGVGHEQDDWEENWSDEPEPMKPWMMTLVFAGLVILAAIICALLWRFTHMDQYSGGATDGIVTESPEPTEPDEPSVSPEVQTAEPFDEDQGSDASDEGETSEVDQPSEPSTSPTDEPVSTQEPDEPSVPQEPEDGDTSMSFDAVQESVTPKDVVNLRSVPSTLDENTVVVQASNGEVLSRTGVNSNTGWSRIDYNGQTLYAVTQYLTTDLDYKTPVRPSDPNRVSTISGRVIIFADCDDQMTPKEYVNLRTEPSTTEGDATVRCQVSNGEVVHRTGYSADSGWSRVEYNGEVLYVVTSLMLLQ